MRCLPLTPWMNFGLALWLATGPVAVAAASAELIASPEPGWPQWRGPRRDGICRETGLLPAWPASGPPLIWSSTNLGRGYSAPIITGGRIFLTGDVGPELHVFALDLEGRHLWKATNGMSWKTPYPGARGSCVVREGRLFQMNAHGRVICLEAATSRELWSRNVIEQYGGKIPTWALGECLLVDEDRLIVTPGGTQALMVALDVRNGQTVWASEPLRLGTGELPAHERLAGKPGEVDPAGYGSPILVRCGQQRLLLSCSLRHCFAVDANNGRLLWTRPLRTRFDVVAITPVLCDNAVFFTAPDSSGGRLFRFISDASAGWLEPVWTSPIDTCHGGLVYWDGRLYGSWYRARRGWACIDAGTGAVRYESREIPMGSVLYADGRLYCLSQEGELVLVEPTPDGFQFRGRLRVTTEHDNDVWTHPVILDGRLYVRYHDRLACHDVRETP